MSKPIVRDQHAKDGQSHTQISKNKLSQYGRGQSDLPSKDSVNLGQIFQRTRAGNFSGRIEKLRKQKLTNPEEIRDYEKQHLCSVTISGEFLPTRAARHLVKHSGLICLQLNQLSPARLKQLLEVLRADLYTCLLFISPDGKGLRVVVKIDCWTVQDHEAFFDLLIRYFKTKLGIKEEELHGNSNDVCQLTFLSYDTKAYYNPDSQTMYLNEAEQDTEVAVAPMSRTDEAVGHQLTATARQDEEEEKLNYLKRLAHKIPPDSKSITKRLTNRQWQLNERARQDIQFRPALISRGGVGIIRKGTINLIQGKFGQHKSRIAELLASLLLAHHECKTDFLGFQKLLEMFLVCFLDSERNLREELPLAIQNIREKAGYDPKSDLDNLIVNSIKEDSRSDRLAIVEKFLQQNREITDKHMVIFLDVITDCVKSFNDDREAMKLVDLLGTFCERYDSTIFAVIHENPNSGKARGHAGTEMTNKASTVLRVGFDDEQDRQLIQLRFIKVRGSDLPEPIYMWFEQETRSLRLADDEIINTKTASKDDSVEIAQFLESVLKVGPVAKGEVYQMLTDTFPFERSTARLRIKKIMAKCIEMTNEAGNRAVLSEDNRYFFLEEVDG